jgi:hypothetical protein
MCSAIMECSQCSKGETKTLTPGGEYSVWTDEANVSSFPESAYPDFRWFIERNAEPFSLHIYSGQAWGITNLWILTSLFS